MDNSPRINISSRGYCAKIHHFYRCRDFRRSFDLLDNPFGHEKPAETNGVHQRFGFTDTTFGL